MKHQINFLEELLLQHFKNEPFHNFFLLYNRNPLEGGFGGTCSDKSLSFLEAARSFGFDAYLHTAYIGGKEIHRLIRILVEGRNFFADVGNGWPSIKLFPADESIEFECFGMKYRTEITYNKVLVFLNRNGKEILQLEIDPKPRNESDILNSISKRFSSGINYPFNSEVRFSLVVNEAFLFLRGDVLEIYRDDGFLCIINVDKCKVSNFISENFNYDTTELFDYLENKF